MIEYLYNAIRASAGNDITIAARATYEDGTSITTGCQLHFYNDEKELIVIDGECVNDIWSFTIPADAIQGLKGRYWYAVGDGKDTLNFKQPIYLV